MDGSAFLEHKNLPSLALFTLLKCFYDGVGQRIPMRRIGGEFVPVCYVICPQLHHVHATDGRHFVQHMVLIILKLLYSHHSLSPITDRRSQKISIMRRFTFHSLASFILGLYSLSYPLADSNQHVTSIYLILNPKLKLLY